MLIAVVNSKLGNKTMKATITALTLAASLLGGNVQAQDMSMTMEVGLSMIELAAQRELQHYGFGDQDVMGLTLTQIASIKAVATSSDYSDSERKQQIGIILAN
jgi:hypothetical protein